MNYDRAIELAYDQTSDTLYDAVDCFKTAKDGHELRKLYNEGHLKLSCCECGQPLLVSGSKKDHLHFKHFPKADDCDLKNGTWTQSEIEVYNEVLRGKERPRHKYLKNIIADRLKKTEGVDTNSVIADTRFFFDQAGKRKPDVYCKYKDYEVVFEIQLSRLSQRYILNRYNFYRNKGFYLVWILDDFDVHGQSSMEKDIKYLSEYHNFFKLDEGVKDFRLSCTYKMPLISDKNKVITPWRNKSVTLNELKFDPQLLQVFYLDFGYELLQVENEQQKLLQQEIRKLADEIKKEKQIRSEVNVQAVIDKLKFFKNREWNFYKFDLELDSLSIIELEILNSRFGFISNRTKGKTLLNYYIENATKGQHSFVHFLLREERIDMDINATDDDGTTTFQHIYANHELDYKEPLLKSIFKRHYSLTASDIIYFDQHYMPEDRKLIDRLRIKWLDQIKDKNLIDMLFEKINFFTALESAKIHQMIGWNYPGWVSFAVKIMLNNKMQWNYVQRAFKRFGLWEIIMKEDKHKSFQKQVAKIEAAPPEQSEALLPLIKELYPEIL